MVSVVSSMIYINLSITNPFSDKFENVYSTSGRVSKYKAWEFQIYRSDTIVELESRITFQQDHAGFKLGVGLFSWTIDFNFYDTRHWDDETNDWMKYER